MKSLMLFVCCFTGTILADVPIPPAATQSQVNSGTAVSVFVSPATLAGWSGNSQQVTNLVGFPYTIQLTNQDQSVGYAFLSTNVVGKTTNLIVNLYSTGLFSTNNPPATPVYPGQMFFWNSNATYHLYVISSTNNALVWTVTNKVF